MKKLLVALVLLVAGSALAQQTPNIHLNLPSRDTKFWDIPINQNWTLLDNYLSGVAPLPAGFPYMRKGTLSGTVGAVLCLDNTGFATTVSCTPIAISSIDASAITSGTLNILRIPGMDVSKIISGVFDMSRINTFGTGGTKILTTTLGSNPTANYYAKWDSNGQLVQSTVAEGGAFFNGLAGNPSDNSSLNTILNSKPAYTGFPVVGHCAYWAGSATLGDAGAACGSSGGGPSIQINSTPTSTQSVLNFQVSGPYASWSNPSGGNVLLTTTQPTRLLTFIAGNGASAVSTSDSMNHIFNNRYGFTVTVQDVYCETDSGTVVINLQRDDGTPANITASTLTCSSTGASSNSFNAGENIINNGQFINFQVLTPDGVATTVRLVVKYQ